MLHGATAITQFATNAALCFVVLVAGYESLKGRLSSGSLLSFVYYCSEIAKAGEKLLKNAQNVSLISVALEEAFDILDSPTEEFIETETKKTFKIDGYAKSVVALLEDGCLTNSILWSSETILTAKSQGLV